MGGKVKEFQKIIQDDADFKETVAGDHVSECPLSSRPRQHGTLRVRSCCSIGRAYRHMRHETRWTPTARACRACARTQARVVLTRIRGSWQSWRRIKAGAGRASA